MGSGWTLAGNSVKLWDTLGMGGAREGLAGAPAPPRKTKAPP